MAPKISIHYNSGGGNGWCGIGWNIPVQSVSVNTKFGVPRYDGEETYILNGAEIVDAGNGLYKARVEGAFQRIRRFGTIPTDYWWEVTDKSGTRYLYGLSENSRLQSYFDDNIFLWNLEKVIDTNGNTHIIRNMENLDTLRSMESVPDHLK